MNPLQWLVPWEPSVIVIFFTGAMALWFIRYSRQHPLQLYQKLCFWIGLASLYIVSQTQFDYYAEHSFSVHRFQHSILHHMGPFLIALGVPLRWEKRGTVADFFASPVVAVLLFNGLIFFWLVPHIHLIAMLDWRLYRLMNWGMALNGLMFWSLVLSPRYSPGCRIIMMLALIPPQIAIGALLFLSSQDLYPVYSLCGRVFTNMSPLMDQQIGGLILWITGPMMSVLGILVVLRKEWMLKSLAQN